MLLCNRLPHHDQSVFITTTERASLNNLIIHKSVREFGFCYSFVFKDLLDISAH